MAVNVLDSHLCRVLIQVRLDLIQVQLWAVSDERAHILHATHQAFVHIHDG